MKTLRMIPALTASAGLALASWQCSDTPLPKKVEDGIEDVRGGVGEVVEPSTTLQAEGNGVIPGGLELEHHISASALLKDSPEVEMAYSRIDDQLIGTSLYFDRDRDKRKMVQGSMFELEKAYDNDRFVYKKDPTWQMLDLLERTGSWGTDFGDNDPIVGQHFGNEHIKRLFDEYIMKRVNERFFNMLDKDYKITYFDAKWLVTIAKLWNENSSPNGKELELYALLEKLEKETGWKDEDPRIDIFLRDKKSDIENFKEKVRSL
ncbi:MAG: hypothetical protein Q8P68_03525 [Candidatus Peregrinibacteria bacterium]|nr:hypothetical protein [Candidatus Peregrinibacteria bacterium]MDZ4245329.1 hypothetical protein [Candidatus Gracilibacteria bacterium]